MHVNLNAENQITQVDGGAATYAYDGEGRRMKKTYNGETTYTFYGPGGVISEFTTTTGVTAASATDRSSYRTSDKLGSAVLLLASNGTVIENNRTLPYGETWLSDVAPVQKKKFTTYERDAESNLDYAMNRYYANNNGRFVSVDKGPVDLKMPLSMNRYIYTGNDPVNRTDPTGNVWVCGSHVIDSTDEGLVITGFQNCTWYESGDVPELPEPNPPNKEPQQVPERLYLPFDNIGKYGTFANVDQVNFLKGVMRLVHESITTRGGCANLLERAGGESAQQVFMGQSFNYAPNVSGVNADQTADVLSVVEMARNPAGTIGRKTWVDNEFFGLTPSQGAHVMVHELMHAAGRPTNVVNSPQTFTDIVEKCNFSHPFPNQ